MLMNEWRKYRDRQIRKAIQEAREAEPEGGEQPAEAEASARQREASGAAAVAPPQPARLKSAEDRPKEVLDRLTAGNDDLRDRLVALRARQQVLPLDVEEPPSPPSGERRAVESRAQLVQRLLDPVLSLEETATLLDVCPTTVRRYTNRGILKCFRTPGNQRRFRLSEVMSFMEQREQGQEV